MRTHHYGLKQAVVNRKILEFIRVGEKVFLIIQTRNWKGKVVNRKKIKYLNVTEKSHVQTVNEEIKESSSE